MADKLTKFEHFQFKPDAYIQAITPDKAFLHYTLNTATLVSSVLTQIHTLPKATYGQLKPEGPKKKVSLFSRSQYHTSVDIIFGRLS